MAVHNFTTNADSLGDGQFVSLDVRALLLKGTGYTFDPDDEFVSDLVPASNEVSASGYSRQVLTTKSRTVNLSGDTPPNKIIYSCDTLNFGTITAGDSVTSVVVFVHVTNDSDSYLITQFTIVPVDSGAVSPFQVIIPASGIFEAF